MPSHEDQLQVCLYDQIILLLSTGQRFMPVRGILPFWQRPPPIPPQGAHQQPWVFVQHPQGPTSPSPVAPSQPQPVTVQPLQPSAPTPEPEVLQCPVCKALLPPSVDRDEHVNSHFD